ncbi:SIR2 family protein [Pseudomonas sp. D4-18]|uniref:SIR2 family NAD-dependent protein deacylase n=1 Tax=Pseudomonas sp. D4-18 TaxID=2817395 RepID=UPI003DA8B533
MESSKVHYDAVRRALQNGNAAVMVGAGFSRNAENGDDLATWAHVAKELWRELNPDLGELKEFSISMVTQLGEQYARVFSKPALEDLLKRLIPDDRVSPGVLHKKLLALQWCEVFTTNYDTLLERAAENIVEQAHYVVTCREDIPQSKMLNRRRIVKLHGSFPSQRPFIFTEEDYRRYPDQSAPFVNLVRQSILENVFCLIGFSGDDPNFLHWIGWVRDVLDQHALPIYLFLGRKPTLGQQRLLEARRVTPVVLPILEGAEESDYAARYSELMRILKEPLNTEPKAWGTLKNSVPLPNGSSPSNEEKLEYMLQSYCKLQNLRVSYPGWFVAPRDVRQNFSLSVSQVARYIYSNSLQDHILQSYPHIGVAIMAGYAWHTEVLLQCFDDGLAEFSINLLEKADGSKYLGATTEHARLVSLSIDSQSTFEDKWKELALGLLRWARQELRYDDFKKLSRWLSEKFPNDLNLKDEIVYEQILLELYKGDRDVAQNFLMNWDVKSADGYMFVRKGMLLGEVGEVSVGLSTGLMGLTKIRRNQRSRTSSVRYLSQEAWACLAISYLQKTLAWSKRLQEQDREPENGINPEDLNQRLADLAAIDHDVILELQLLMADLNAETPVPSQPVSRIPLFELGRYSTIRHVGGSTLLDKKTRAAFAWLSLSDRVSLVPRVGDTTFDIGAFGQAAWWVQYVDSMERVLSVMIRTLNKKLLEPRADNQLMHSSGWLSRYQVARVKEGLACSICEQSLSLIERFFENANYSEELSRVTVFHLELVGRLIIRIADSDVVFLLGERIVALHHSKAVARSSEVWKSLAICMHRCFENLSLGHRRKIVESIASLPAVFGDASIRNVYKNDWVMFHCFVRRSDEEKFDSAPSEVKKVIDDEISLLRLGGVNGNLQSPNFSGIWRRLFWVRDWGFMSEKQTEEISDILSEQPGWPQIADHHFWTPLVWMLKTSKHKDFKKWLFTQKLRGFRLPADEKVGAISRFSWRLNDDDDFFLNVAASLERSKWSQRDYVKCIAVVKSWWDDEWGLIINSIERVNELKQLACDRLTRLDRLTAKFIDDYGFDAFCKSEVFSWFSVVMGESSFVGSEFLRTRIAEGFSELNNVALLEVEERLIAGLLITDISSIYEVSSVASYWINHKKSSRLNPPAGLVAALVGIVSTRNVPALSMAMRTLSQLVTCHSDWLSDSSYSMLSAGLNIMLHELRYEDRPDGTGIPDELVPELRFGCVRLAQVLVKLKQSNVSGVASAWIDESYLDPLPELRYFYV